MRNESLPKHAALVYQVGIANVFLSNGDGRLRRVLQHAYGPCESYAAGLMAAGVPLTVHHCDQAGDVDSMRDRWEDGAGNLWAEGKHPPVSLAVPRG